MVLNTNQIAAMDRFIERTLKAFLQAQRQAYKETVYSEDEPIAHQQATYETACLAINVVLRFVCDTEQFPDNIEDAWSALHDAICTEGDRQLRALGYKPEEF